MQTVSTFELTTRFNLMRQGTVRLVLKFGEAAAVTITVVVYAEF